METRTSFSDQNCLQIEKKQNINDVDTVPIALNNAVFKQTQK